MTTQTTAKEWVSTKLVDACDLNMGQSPDSKTYNNVGEGLPVARIYCSDPKKVVEPGDILMSVRAPVGPVNVADIKSCIGRGLAGLRSKRDLLDQDFLYFELVLNEKKIASLGSGSTFHAINKSHLANLEFVLPAIAEQKAIAQALTAIQNAIAEQEKLITKLKELKRSMMQHLFTRGTSSKKTKMTEIGEIPESWEIAPLGKHLKKTETKDPSKAPNEEFIYIDVSAVSREYFKIISSQKMLGKDAPSRARKRIQTGDIIFATVRPTLQRIAIVPEEFNNQVCSTGYCVLRPREDLDADFLFHYLCGDVVLKHVEGLQSGASYPAIRDGVLFEMNIPFPKLEEQRVIGSVLSAIDKRMESAQEKLNVYQNLFKTLLHELMSGERRVKNI